MKKPMLAVAGPFLLVCSVATGALAQGEAPLQGVAPSSTPAASASATAACAERGAGAQPALLPAAGALARAQSALMLQLIAARDGREAAPAAVSPSGIAAVLGALDLGADPAMHGAIVRTLQLKGRQGRSVGRIEGMRRALRLMAAAPADATLSSASAVFVDARQPLKPGVAERFMAEAQMPVRAVDLSGPAGVREVNAFVAERTRGRIPAILGEADAGAALVAVNAFHFLGCWRVPFDPALTRPEPFTTLDGTPVEVPTMMLDEATLSHRLEGRFAAVDLSYDDPRYSLVLVTTTDKPAAAPDFVAARRLLDGGAFTRGPIALELPRFRIEADADLLPALSRLGLRAGLKSPGALSGIAAGIRLGAVRQKSFIAVDEQGTQAAAATAAVATRAATLRPMTIAFDKPFVFALRHRPTGLILLAGYVADPS